MIAWFICVGLSCSADYDLSIKSVSVSREENQLTVLFEAENTGDTDINYLKATMTLQHGNTNVKVLVYESERANLNVGHEKQYHFTTNLLQSQPVDRIAFSSLFVGHDSTSDFKKIDTNPIFLIDNPMPQETNHYSVRITNVKIIEDMTQAQFVISFTITNDGTIDIHRFSMVIKLVLQAEAGPEECLSTYSDQEGLAHGTTETYIFAIPGDINILEIVAIIFISMTSEKILLLQNKSFPIIHRQDP